MRALARPAVWRFELPLLGLALLLTGCATPYQPRGLTGGFTETRLDTNTFRVDFQGNGFTSRGRVEVYQLRRAAELTLEHVADYFVVVDGGTERNISSITTPGRYSAATTGSYAVGSTAYGTATTVGTYTPGVTVPITKYDAGTAIKVFRGEKPADLANAYDARDVLRYVSGPLASKRDTARVAMAATVVPQPIPPSTTGPVLSGAGPTIRPVIPEVPGPVAQAEPLRAGGPPVYSGTSGHVAWEVTAIEQNRSADGTMIRWDYELVLQERDGVGISFHTRVSDSEGPRTRTSSDRSQFSRRLEPRSELRYQSYYWIQLTAAGTVGFGTVPGGLEGVRLLQRFEGRDDGGRNVRVDVRFSLDPRVGDRPQVTADTTSLAGPRPLRPEELASLAGTWSGHLQDQRGFTFALALAVRPDGQFDAAVGTVVKQRFQGSLAISRTGEIEYATRVATGRATIHEDGPQRVVVGSATPKPGASSTAVSYSFRARSTGTPPAVVTPVVAAVPTPVPTATPPVVPAPGAEEILTNESILSMVKAGFDESVILAKITTTPTRFDTRTDALIELKRAGVPDRVLAAMVGKR